MCAAITTANGSTNPVEFIKFDIPSSDPGYNATTGVWTISPATALPAVTAHTIIDATTQPGYAGQPVVQLTPQASIDLTNQFTGLKEAGFIPPDPQGAAGPNSYLETVNENVAIYTPKTTGAAAVTDSLQDFFFKQGGLTHVNNGSDTLGDTFSTYDPLAGRFIVGLTDLAINGGTFFDGGANALLLAVSKSSDPTTLTAADWYFYEVSTTEPGVALQDYPGNVGYNADALVITENSFSTTSLLHVLVNTISINALTNGQTLTAGTNLFQTDFNGESLRPTTMLDSKPGDPMWFLQEHPSSGSTNTSIDVVKMSGVLSSSPTFTTTTLAVNPYVTAQPELQPGGSQNHQQHRFADPERGHAKRHDRRGSAGVEHGQEPRRGPVVRGRYHERHTHPRATRRRQRRSGHLLRLSRRGHQLSGRHRHDLPCLRHGRRAVYVDVHYRCASRVLPPERCRRPFWFKPA